MSEITDKKTRLVPDTTEKLRDLILEQPPGTHLGSLQEVAKQLGVGIVTVQQAARVLEHEGLLAVKRGPGGGYYGKRPDDAALERAFATYLRIHNISYREAFELTVLLDCEIIQAAAQNLDSADAEAIASLIKQLSECETGEDRIQFELDFRETLLNIYKRPLLELLAGVSMQLYKARSDPEIFADAVALADWKQGRQRILHAILEQDSELAYFEAQRYRRMVSKWMHTES